MKSIFDKVYSKDIASPVLIEPAAMQSIVSRLRELGYTYSACAKQCPLDLKNGVIFHSTLPSTWEPDLDNPVQILLALFISSRPVPLDRLERLFDPQQLDSLQAMRLVQITDNTAQAEICLFPCFDLYIATDQARPNDAINQIMFLWNESYILGGVVDRQPFERCLDLCTGSGIHALLAAKHSNQVIGIDINPRAIAFSEFNAGLNGIKNSEFILGDLYDPVDGDFNLILANPPYNPDDGTPASSNFWSGGKSGDELLNRIIQGLPEKLRENGLCHIFSLFPNKPGSTLQSNVKNLLQKHSDYFDAFEDTVPANKCRNLFVRKPPQANKEAHFFGTLNLLKRKEASPMSWKAFSEPPDRFNESGDPIFKISRSSF